MVEIQRASPAQSRAYVHGANARWHVESPPWKDPDRPDRHTMAQSTSSADRPHGQQKLDLQRGGPTRLDCGRLHNASIRADPDYWRFYSPNGFAQDLRRAHRVVALKEAGTPCAQAHAVSWSASLPESRLSLPKPRLLDQVRDAIRARHYSRRTEKSYVAGSAATSSSMASATPPRWARRRFVVS